MSTTCTRCGGAGKIPAFHHIDGGLCYACDGTGAIDGAPKPLPRGHLPGRTVQTKSFGPIFINRAPAGHLIATNGRGEGVPFEVINGACVRCGWFTRYSGRTDRLLGELDALTTAARSAA